MARPSKYPPEFRERAARIARESERPIAAVARDLGIHHETLRVWVRQDEADDGTRSDRLTTAEREELTLLRHEVRTCAVQTRSSRRRACFSPASSTNPGRGERLHR